MKINIILNDLNDRLLINATVVAIEVEYGDKRSESIDLVGKVHLRDEAGMYYTAKTITVVFKYDDIAEENSDKSIIVRLKRKFLKEIYNSLEMYSNNGTIADSYDCYHYIKK